MYSTRNDDRMSLFVVIKPLAQLLISVWILRTEDTVIFVQATKPYREKIGEERRGEERYWFYSFSHSAGYR